MLEDAEVARLAGMSIWEQLDELITAGTITIDRPRGTPHPKVPEYVYPMDYGYVDGTDGGDGSGIDVWVGRSPGLRATALICTYDAVKRNSELKVAWDCVGSEIDVIEAFYAPQPQAVLVVRRGDEGASGPREP
ncbi:hypothetical protein [Micromonospora sp. DT62]|uniref:hypothetical protein n=1 Tax=Micromonospora sp. DT62 TaxID=3416521 RepID=UPI003CF63765